MVNNWVAWPNFHVAMRRPSQVTFLVLACLSCLDAVNLMYWCIVMPLIWFTITFAQFLGNNGPTSHFLSIYSCGAFVADKPFGFVIIKKSSEKILSWTFSMNKLSDKKVIWGETLFNIYDWTPVMKMVFMLDIDKWRCWKNRIMQNRTSCSIEWKHSNSASVCAWLYPPPSRHLWLISRACSHTVSPWNSWTYGLDKSIKRENLKVMMCKMSTN